MRSSRLLLLSLVTAVTAFAAAPVASAAPPNRPSPRDTAEAPRPVALASAAAARDSVHVFLVTQLVVPDSLGRDSGAVRVLARNAGVTILLALQAERIAVYKIGAFTRPSSLPSALSTIRTEPPNPHAARATLIRGSAAPRWRPSLS